MRYIQNPLEIVICCFTTESFVFWFILFFCFEIFPFTFQLIDSGIVNFGFLARKLDLLFCQSPLLFSMTCQHYGSFNTDWNGCCFQDCKDKYTLIELLKHHMIFVHMANKVCWSVVDISALNADICTYGWQCVPKYCRHVHTQCRGKWHLHDVCTYG